MLNKLNLFSFLILIILSSCNNDNGFYETKAIDELDNMAETIGELNSCSYSLNTLSKQINKDDESNKKEGIHDVYMQGPNKFYIHSVGTKGQRSFWYNGERFSYYSHDRHVYDTVKAEGNVVEVMDFLNKKYNIYFPAADFFYPSFTDDIIDFSDEVILLENQIINQKEYIVVQATNNKKSVTIWIDKANNLPFKFIISPQTGQGLYYEAIFSNWKLNPKFYDVLFEYTPSKSTKREPLQLKQ